jgi:hypothetical protein
MLEQAKADLGQLLQFGVWLVALIVLFVVEPPPLSRTSGTPAFVHAAGFVAAIVIALLLVATRKAGRRPTALWWAALTVLAASVAMFFTYLSLTAAWTCDYDGNGPVVIGGELLAEAKREMQYLGQSGCAAMIADSAGRTEELWPRSELVFRQLALAGCFMATVLGFAAAAVLAIEAMRLATPGSPAGGVP